MCDLVSIHGAHLLGSECGDGDCLAFKCNKFNFVSCTGLMNHDDGAQVAFVQAVFWQVCGQYDSLEFLHGFGLPQIKLPRHRLRVGFFFHYLLQPTQEPGRAVGLDYVAAEDYASCAGAD